MSLVLVSPSMLMRLKLPLAAVAKAVWSKGWAMLRSVATTLNMVAMLGWIIPAPLATPVRVTVASPSVRVREANLGFVSVVMMAVAASSQPSGRSFWLTSAMPVVDLGHGQLHPDHPGVHDEDRAVPGPQVLLRLLGHQPGVDIAQHARCRHWRSPALTTTP